MTALLDRVPVESITEQARQVRPGRAVLTLIAGVLFGLGWVTARALGVAWLAVAWSWTAFKVGFREGRGRPGGPSEPR
jgi:uncharacterized membrane protein YedE/YeeE